jgi:hypothetical protein
MREEFEYWREEVNDSHSGSVLAIKKGQFEVVVLQRLRIKTRVIDDF